MNSNAKFSVLMSIYANDRLGHFIEAFESIWKYQSLKPNEVVLVVDGPIAKGVDEYIEKAKIQCPVLKIIRLQVNQGLAHALNIGLDHCTHDLVARMDSDDVSVESRFAKQVEFFKENLETDILGGQLIEFGLNRKDLIGERLVPTNHSQIVKEMRWRCAVSHPSVMYKRSSILSLEGYNEDVFPEDYDLWARATKSGMKFANLPDVLLYFRIGDLDSFLARRKGLSYAKKEAGMLANFHQIGFLSTFQYVLALCIRLPSRLLPYRIFYILFRLLH